MTMKKTVIETSDPNINLMAQMLKIKAGFAAMGMKNFPREEIIAQCPHIKLVEANAWMVSAENVWRLRNNDEDIVQAFEKALHEARELVNMDVIHEDVDGSN